MPPYYIGGSENPIGAMFRQPSQNPGAPRPVGPAPVNENPNPTPAPAPQQFNGVGAQAVRPTGPSNGFDASYLQNLATAIGGLFSRPQGNLSFNPLGNLSEISPPSGELGNAPMPGLPDTWLQDALNGLGFSFAPKTTTTEKPGRPTRQQPYRPFGPGRNEA